MPPKIFRRPHSRGLAVYISTLNKYVTFAAYIHTYLVDRPRPRPLYHTCDVTRLCQQGFTSTDTVNPFDHEVFVQFALLSFVIADCEQGL